ncbi:MAG: extracellular solute-binding protein [Lachnospiraceae bacterium]|nr:extracellular solute-binding protein [Lachnospiraceae bacterium]
MRKQRMKRILAGTITAAVLLTLPGTGLISPIYSAAAADTPAAPSFDVGTETAIGKEESVVSVSDLTMSDFLDVISSYTVDTSIPSYADYLEDHSGKRPDREIVIEAKDYIRYSDGEKKASGRAEYQTSAPEEQDHTDDQGRTEEGTAVLTTEAGMIEYSFNVEEEGFYQLSLLYCTVEGKNASAQRTFFIDGKLPYEELALVQFERQYEMEVDGTRTGKGGVTVPAWRVDNQGNDLKPSMKEVFCWNEKAAFDSNGYITDPLRIYLTKGEHVLSIVSTKEPMLLRKITFSNTKELPTYSEKLAKWQSEHNDPSEGKDARITIEAEEIARVSSASLYPKQDQTSPAVVPSSSKELLNNTIGGGSWNSAGEWIEYDFHVDQAGYYSMNLFLKQNFIKGIYVSRKITIDGEVPFEEFSAYGFTYAQGWRNESLKDENGKPYLIWLEEGDHTLRMEAVLGDFAPIIGQVEDCVSQLNTIYRQVIQLIGTSPSEDRDYNIERKIPGLVDEMTECKADLDEAIRMLRSVAGSGSDKEATLVTMSDDLKKLIKDPEKFRKMLGTYKSDMRACGTWLTTVVDQPLQVDCIELCRENSTTHRKKAGIFSSIWFEITRLYWSFFIDYNQLGNTAEAGSGATLTLWVGSGRDQANIIKSLIDESFTGEKGINVNVMIVDINTLLQATLAGQGPDIAINAPYEFPMNYGTRSAVLDLSTFEDLPEVMERFDESAMAGFTYEGHVYALPETQTFPMMFYRKDILEELDLELPRTWADVNVAMTVLAKNQMEIGVLAGENIFAMMLFQEGGSYYNESSTRTLLGEDEAVSAFKRYCELYTDYALDKETSVEERLKTGECPIILADYTLYNTLQVSAPDIKGLWGVAPVPGMEEADQYGNKYINNVVGGTGSSTMIMADTDYPEECWEFLKWWTSTETQIAYSTEMESALGASARVATANLEAFEMISWPTTDLNELMEQHEHVIGIPQVPGGYYTWRSINNAFYSVTTDRDKATPREELMDAVILINDELDYKRTELHLPTAADLGLE